MVSLMDSTSLKGKHMTKTEIENIQSRVQTANDKIEEITRLRTEYQNALRQLEINEAGWRGFLEALTPLLSDESTEG